MSEYSQKPLVRPLTQLDSQVLDSVYGCYVVNKPGETFNVEALFSVVSDIMGPSFGLADPSIKYDRRDTKDKSYLANFEPPTHLLKHIACQMMETPHDEHHSYAHETTMGILKDLDAYSWCAKAVTALAAFALEYGNFWHLFQVPKEDNLGKSLAVLNHVQAFERNRRDIFDYNLVVKTAFLSVDCLVRLERMSKQGYDVKDDIPTLETAIQEFPVFVYWIVLTIVVCASYLDILMGYSSSAYELSSISSKISAVLIKLKDYLAKIDNEKALIDEYIGRYRVAFQTPTEIVQVLKCLLFPRDLKDPHVYHGSTGSMVSIEVFWQKHVLLFLSGLYSIADETRLLKSIHEGLMKDPKEVKGFRKDDFKILWAPIVDEQVGGDTSDRKQFEDLKRQMDWYVVEYSIIPPICKKLIRDRLRYQNKPMVPVFNPQGRLTNENALHMLFAWGDPAFPWGKDDDLHLNMKWNWFWTEMKKHNPKIDSWIKDEGYIVIYGRTDTEYCDDQWLLIMPEQLERVKRDEVTKRSDVVINYYHHGKGKDELRIVNGFWAYVENLFDSMKRKTTKDPSFEEAKAFLGLRQEQAGWVLLSKGANVKLLCRGDTFYQTLKEFDAWKLNIERDPGFDVSFAKHYETLFSKLPHHANCLRLDVKYHVSDIYSPIYCMCGRPMDIELVRYVCCHGYKEEPVDAGDVQIFR
ncbi:protein SIEVE ELEMENT OCCLUSION B-like [Neltuma alba]|uniref:protein SIEVE ELEMENT OCCLUSION B-like n=1 Tax=Neltuma alba TaxID=207710 RepID=UPI0010A302A9|nr:protein SIEVE ELEMENT OCCLUSION B-like [Prosopis alba]